MKIFRRTCSWFQSVFGKPTRRNWYEACCWLAATVLGGLLPLWGSYVLFCLRGPSPAFAEFVRHGEFALYSASLLAAAFFLILREWRTGYFPFRMLFGMFTVTAMLLAAIIFAGVFEANQNPGAVINMGFLQPFSLVLYGFSVVLAFAVTLIDMVGGAPFDPQELQAEEIADLASDFHSLED